MRLLMAIAMPIFAQTKIDDIANQAGTAPILRRSIQQQVVEIHHSGGF